MELGPSEENSATTGASASRVISLVDILAIGLIEKERKKSIQIAK